MTRKQIVRGLLVTLVSLVVLELLLEAFLWFVDPLGIATYVADLSNLVTIANAEGYTLAPGVQPMRYWSFTIDADGNRVMPPSSGDCVIRFVGDSVTFGQSVDDDQPFPYLIARATPNVQFVNAAKIAYNIGNIRYSVEHHAADGYIYTLSDNDQGLSWSRPESEYGQPRELPPHFSAFRYYLAAFQERGAPPVNDWDGFWRDLAALNARDDVLIFVVSSPLADQVAERYPELHVIPVWSPQQQVSWIDGHPNAAGHEYLKTQMDQGVRDFVDALCATSG